MPGGALSQAHAGRLLLSEGPIDLIIGAEGPPGEQDLAFAQARAAFAGLLARLAGELAMLRQPIALHPLAEGPVARRMIEAAGRITGALSPEPFLTPMAAVAGAVADHMLAALVAGRRLEKAFVNDGGDIALHLAPGATLRLAMVDDPGAPRLDGTIEIGAADPVRGIATSGRHGRSFSLGIADAVTVLAPTAALADAAATVIASATTIDHPSITRQPAIELDPDSDLGQRLVTIEVGPLEPAAIDRALAAGAALAQALIDKRLIVAARLSLAGRERLLSRPG